MSLRHRRLVDALVLATVVIAIIVLSGWTLRIEPMKSIVPGLTTMNPMTAACLLLACLSLWMGRTDRPSKARGMIAMLSAGCVLFVGCAKWIDIALGTRICPDGLLFRAQLDRQLPFPSRLAPNAAACFILVAVALLAIGRPRWPRAFHPQWLMVPVLGSSLAAVIGYCYDASGFYKFRESIPMALHTAVGLGFIAIAVVFSRPGEGILRLLPRRSLGARSVKRLLPACVLIPSTLGGIALFAEERDWLGGRGAATAMVAVLTVVAMSALTIVNAIALSRAEAVRREAEIRLRETVVELDTRNRELGEEVRERKLAEEQAAHRASHDFLTGLPNRLLFVDRLEKAVSSARRNGQPLALIYIDIDGFKPVNDHHGHNAGDALLIAFAKRLSTMVREVDTVARLGGDEFGVIVTAPVSEAEVLGLATRVSESATRRYRLNPFEGERGIVVSVGISMGIALLPGHVTDPDDLVKVADSAMYRAKTAGKAIGRSTNIEIAVA